MKLLCLTLFIIGASCSDDSEIAGDFADISPAPYQAQILTNGTVQCYATILGEKWLVITNECLENTPVGTPMTVITGSTYSGQGGVEHETEYYIFYDGENFNSSDSLEKYNDIALIKLKKPIEFNENQKAIPLAKEAPKSDDVMIISRFRKQDESPDAPKVLTIDSVPVLDKKVCDQWYESDPIRDDTFCAGNGPTDSCEGDSGSAGVINGELAGIMKSSMDCGLNYFPRIYTRIHLYHDWIANIMSKY